MKNFIVISIVIAVAAAVFAAIVFKDDLFKSAEAGKSAAEQTIESNDLKKNVKIPMKPIKIQKLKIDRKNVEKYKKGRDKDPNFQKKSKSCGE